MCTRRTYGRGQYLWYQGDEGDRLMIVAAGMIKVALASAQGDEVVLTTLGKYDTSASWPCSTAHHARHPSWPWSRRPS